jgi:ribosomal protein L34E
MKCKGCGRQSEAVKTKRAMMLINLGWTPRPYGGGWLCPQCANALREEGGEESKNPPID